MRKEDYKLVTLANDLLRLETTVDYRLGAVFIGSKQFSLRYCVRP